MVGRRHHLPAEVFIASSRVVSLTICTARRRRIFLDPDAVACCLESLHRIHGDDRRLLTYCIMPDHVHLLVRIRDVPPGDVVAAVKGLTTRALRRHRDRVTNIWQRGYYDHVVRRREDLRAVARYIIDNPVRAGLVESWRAWPWIGSLEWPELDTIMTPGTESPSTGADLQERS